MLVLLLPALVCVALGVVVGWWMRRLHDAYAWDDELAEREEARRALAEMCVCVDALEPPPFAVVTAPYDWNRDGA